MIDRSHELPLVRQAALLRLSRSTLSYEPRPVPAAELAIMCRIDALRLDYPFAGSRMLRDLLRGENVVIGRDMVRTMMRRMCIEALHRRPNTSKAAPGHKIYPYLLRGLAIERPNQVWCMCGRPPERKVFCVIRRSERVRSCLRPSTRCLYDRWPRWVSPNGPQTRMRHGTAFAPSGVSCSSV
jgi:hypothetical protein